MVVDWSVVRGVEAGVEAVGVHMSVVCRVEAGVEAVGVHKSLHHR